MHHELAPEPTVDTLTTRRMLRCGVVGAVMFIVVFLVDGATRSGYDPARHPVSALSLGARGWVQITNFVVTGVFMVVFAAGLRRALHPGRAATWGPLLIAMFGVGLIASGTFPMVALFVSFGVAWESGNGSTGIIQRITILVGWTWTALLALHVARARCR